VHLCAISDFTRNTLIERMGVAPERVTTAHLAADPLFEQPLDTTGRDAVLRRHGLTAGEYLLFPGHTWRHKNHARALQALRVLGEDYGLRPLLVSTGAAREAQADLQAHIEALGLNGRVRFLGYRPAAEMPALYAGAGALLFPSLFEGFGMPVLEAMWSGCPVVCSQTSSLPEIAGNAAALVDPTSPAEIAAATARVLTDSGWRRELVARGHGRAREFSWSRFTTTVVQTLYVAGARG
jgi:glycosyltransferase involved in cell wall biosynthesis